MPVEVALLGGSFNPPHVGHLLASQYVFATHAVDQVWLMPTFRHPFGKALAPFEHRVRMCELLCADAREWFKVSQVEKDVEGEGRTVEVLEHLRKTSPDHRFTLVIGSDIVPDLPKWKDPERLRELAKMLVLYRAGYPTEGAVGPPLAEVSSSQVRDLLARGVSPWELVPRRVLEYARARRLYEPDLRDE